MIQKKIKALFNPSHYHGWGKTSRYFEGWYYKLISADEKHAFAVIPGIAMDSDGKKHAFIQVLDGKNLSATYHKFDVGSFKPKDDKFELNIGSNYFSEDHLVVDVPGFKADLISKNHVPWPTSLLSPGIMGPFSFVPFMQCYHGILSMDHILSGTIEHDNSTLDFNEGRGYMEKDWGNSFPSAYIWMQSNHFERPGISIKASVAKIPFMGSSFVGFIAGLYLDGKIIQFTTYNFTKLTKSFADISNVEIILTNRNHKLTIKAEREESTSLAAPIQGFMNGRIEESMTAILNVELIDQKTGAIIFKGAGRNAGLEVAGKIEEILT